MKNSKMHSLFLIYFALLITLILCYYKYSTTKYEIFRTHLGHRINVYILSFNRLTVLKKAIASLIKLVPVQNLVIIDNGSDYKPLLDYLHELAKNGSKVYSFKKIINYDELNDISKIIEKHKRIKACDFYAVTDPDVDLDGMPQDFFDVGAEFLNSFSNITVVGPMLRIIDIPKDFAVREIVWEEHLRLFWSRKPKKRTILNKELYYQYGPIDTTMGLFRGNFIHKRFQRGIRLYYPYEARHLDWYITPKTIAEDQTYYIRTTSKNISHWSWNQKISKEQLAAFKMKMGFQDRFSRSFYAVKRDAVSGKLKIVMNTLPF